MFAEAGSLERLKMCADCRVLDMMTKNLDIAAHAAGDSAAKDPGKS